MADAYTPMGGVPDWYAQMLGSAAQNLVRMPDGSLAPAPVYSGPTSIGEMYGGIYGPSGASGSAALTSHPVKLIAVDAATGDPIGTSITGSASLKGNSGTIRTTGQAGTVALPPGVVPASVTRMMGELSAGGAPGQPVSPPGYAVVSAPRSASGTVALGKDTSRLGPTPSPLLAFNGDQGAPALPPALAAINTAVPPLPRARPAVPLPPVMAFIPPPLPRPRPDISPPPQQQHNLLGLLGMLFGGASQPARSTPIQQAPVAPPPVPAPASQPGFNGSNNVYSGELAGANQGFGGVNALMPDSMNTSRWLTGY